MSIIIIYLYVFSYFVGCNAPRHVPSKNFAINYSPGERVMLALYSFTIAASQCQRPSVHTSEFAVIHAAQLSSCVSMRDSRCSAGVRLYSQLWLYSHTGAVPKGGMFNVGITTLFSLKNCFLKL